MVKKGHFRSGHLSSRVGRQFLNFSIIPTQFTQNSQNADDLQIMKIIRFYGIFSHFNPHSDIFAKPPCTNFNNLKETLKSVKLGSVTVKTSFKNWITLKLRLKSKNQRIYKNPLISTVKSIITNREQIPFVKKLTLYQKKTISLRKTFPTVKMNLWKDGTGFETG